MLSHLPSIVVALTVLLLILTTFLVGRARGKYGIHAPATTGNLDFERIFRVQMNTLEAVVLFLPILWLGTVYSDPRIAGGLGLVWVVARYWYVFAYADSAKKRGPAFILSIVASFGLFAISLWGLMRAIVA
ncbi:MAG: MAPEG family protein [Tahibacter sp.]